MGQRDDDNAAHVAGSRGIAKQSSSMPPPSRKRPATNSEFTARKKKPARPVVDSSKIQGSFTSLAERKRRQPTCSIASLRELEDEETLEEDFIGYFNASSESHWTWGKTVVDPISATKKKAKAPRFKRTSGGDRGWASLFGHDEGPGPKLPNSPDRSFFLRFPLEIREKIYGLFLLYPKPILINYDFATVDRDNLRIHPILRICKQVSEEASSFLYRQNIFRTILRRPRTTWHLHESFMIDNKFFSLFRNLIIECPRDSYSLDWYEDVSTSLEKLVQAKTVLESLTLVVIPNRVGRTETAVGMEKHPITFADFFYFPGRLMKTFRRLSCKKLNIIVKTTSIELSPVSSKTPTPAPTPSESGVSVDSPIIEATTTKRFLITIDLTYLARAAIEEGDLKNPETVKMQRAKAIPTWNELRRLKMRYEDIFKDDERAVEEGLCRIMGKDEKITDLIVSVEKN